MGKFKNRGLERKKLGEEKIVWGGGGGEEKSFSLEDNVRFKLG